MNIEKAKSWAENIPMEGLWEELRRITGLFDLKFTSRVEERNNYLRVTYQSQDLVDKVDFLKLLFSEIYIENFNSNIIESEDGKFKYWGTASFRYKHPDGGRNGYSFLEMWYSDDKGWEFEQ